MMPACVSCPTPGVCEQAVIESVQPLGWSADDQGRAGRLFRLRLSRDPAVYHVLRPPRATPMQPGEALCVQSGDGTTPRRICETSIVSC